MNIERPRFVRFPRTRMVAAVAVGGLTGAFCGAVYGCVTDAIMQPRVGLEITGKTVGDDQSEGGSVAAPDTNHEGVAGIQAGAILGLIGGATLCMGFEVRRTSQSIVISELSLPAHYSEGPDGGGPTYF